MSAIDQPAVWGPSLWRAIHLVALGYPSDPSEEDVRAYGSFFEEALPAVLPCAKCIVNYRRHLLELPVSPYLVGGDRRLFEWTVKMHNIVNKELGKGGGDWTPDRALAAMALTSPGASVPAVGGGVSRGVSAMAPGVIALLLLLVLLVAAFLLLRRSRRSAK